MNSARQQYGLLLMGLLALMIAWVSSYSNFVTIETHVISREQDQLLSLAETVAGNVSNHFDQLEAELEILARDPQPLQLEHYYKIKRGEIYEVGVLNPLGEVLSAYPSSHANSQLTQDVQGLINNPQKKVGVIYHDGGQFFVHVLRQISIKDEEDKVLYVRVSVEWLYQALIAPIRAGEKGYASVKDASGVIIMHPNRTDIGKDVLEQRKMTYPDFDWSELEALVQKQKQGVSGVGIYHSLWFTEDASKRVKKFNAFAPARIGDTFWIVNISKDYDEVVDFLKYRAYGLWAINLSVLFVVMLSVYFYDRLIKHKKALKVQETLSEEVVQLNEVLQKDLVIRQRISDEMEKRKQWYEAIFNGVSEGIAIVNFDAHHHPDLILDANEPLAHLFGYTQQQLMSMRFSELISDGEIAVDFALKPQANATFLLESMGVSASGTVIPIEIEYQLMRYDNQWRGIMRIQDISKRVMEREVSERAMQRFKGLVAEIAGRIDPALLTEIEKESSERYHLALLLDRMNLQLERLYSEEVAENRKREALMVYQSRMAAMGEMLANIAHQWRQPLSVMRMLFDNLKDAFLHNELDLAMIEKQHERMVQLTQHMSRTIDDFRFFFKPQKSPKSFLMSHALAMAVTLVEEPLKYHHIHLEQSIMRDALMFNYESQLSHVFLALLQNSIDALVKNRESGREISINMYHENHQVVVTLKDNGGGVKEDHLDQLFEPYFSTKVNHKGMGLGLSITKMIIDQHFLGSIQVSNNENGLMTSLRLPFRGAYDLESENSQDE